MSDNIIGFDGMLYSTTNISAQNQFMINNVPVLNNTTIGSGVVTSSLTSLGTLLQLNVSGPSALNTFTANSGTITSLSLGSMNITSLTATNANVSNGTTSTLYSTTSNINSLVGTNSNVTTSTVGTLYSTTSNINSLTSTNANVTTGTIGTLYSTTSNINSLTSTNSNVTTGTIGTLYSTTSNINSLVATNSNVTTSTVGTLYSTTSNIASLTSTNSNVTTGTVGTLYSTTSNINSLVGTNSNVTTSTVGTLYSTTSNIASLTATNSNITNSTIGSLYASSGTIGTLYASNLVSGTGTTALMLSTQSVVINSNQSTTQRQYPSQLNPTPGATGTSSGNSFYQFSVSGQTYGNGNYIYNTAVGVYDSWGTYSMLSNVVSSGSGAFQINPGVSDYYDFDIPANDGNSTFTYNSNRSNIVTYDTNNVAYRGLYLQILLPSPINITGVGVLSDSAAAPRSMYVLASNNGTSWTLIYNIYRYLTGWNLPTINIIPIVPTVGTAFSYYRFVVYEVGTFKAVHIGRFLLYDNAPNTTTLGVNTSNPAYTLDVNGVVNATNYKISGTDVLNGTTLGSTVVNSSLQNVGTLSGLTVSGSATVGTLCTTTIKTGTSNYNITLPNSAPTASNMVLATTTSASNSQLVWTSADALVTPSQWTTIGSDISYSTGNVLIGTLANQKQLTLSGQLNATTNLRDITRLYAVNPNSPVTINYPSGHYSNIVKLTVPNWLVGLPARGVVNYTNATAGCILWNTWQGTSNVVTLSTGAGPFSLIFNGFKGNTSTDYNQSLTWQTYGATQNGSVTITSAYWEPYTTQLNDTVVLDNVQGNVGIGITVPTSTLHVNGTVTLAGLSSASQSYVLGYNQSTGLVSYQSTSAATQWTTSGSNITYASGSVGIGTNAPQTALDIMGIEYIRDASGTGVIKQGVVYGNGYIQMGLPSSLTAPYTASSAPLYFTNFNAGSTYMSIIPTSSGATNTANIGINMTNPSAPLHIGSSNPQGVSIGVNTGNSISLDANNSNINQIGSFNFDGYRLILMGGANGGRLSTYNGAWVHALSWTSGGYVGIGITNPGYPLQINTSASPAFVINGGTNQHIYVNQAYFQYWDAMSCAVVGVSGAPSSLYIKNNGYVGIGTPTPQFPLEVASSLAWSTGYPYQVYSLGMPAGTEQVYSIRGSYSFWTFYGGYLSSSDRRKKTNINNADTSSALSKILSLPLKTYNYIDKVADGDELVYGLIAQEVKEIMPEAITLGTAYIPSIYKLATNVVLSEDEINVIITVDIPETSELKVGGKVELVVENIKEKHNATVISFTSYELVVSKWDDFDNTKNVFVVGPEINDYHTLDKPYLAVVCMGGIQELNKLNNTLTSTVATQQTTIDTLNTRVNTLEQQLAIMQEQINSLLNK